MFSVSGGDILRQQIGEWLADDLHGFTRLCGPVAGS